MPVENAPQGKPISADPLWNAIETHITAILEQKVPSIIEAVKAQLGAGGAGLDVGALKDDLFTMLKGEIGPLKDQIVQDVTAALEGRAAELGGSSGDHILSSVRSVLEEAMKQVDARLVPIETHIAKGPPAGAATTESADGAPATAPADLMHPVVAAKALSDLQAKVEALGRKLHAFAG
jgi:hypothetical protein